MSVVLSARLPPSGRPCVCEEHVPFPELVLSLELLRGNPEAANEVYFKETSTYKLDSAQIKTLLGICSGVA